VVAGIKAQRLHIKDRVETEVAALDVLMLLVAHLAPFKQPQVLQIQAAEVVVGRGITQLPVQQAAPVS
jgi:hypothetical protein